MSQQYYAHDQYLSHGRHSNINSITINSTHMLIMTHDNSIQVYDYAPKGFTLFKTLRFHCNIKKLLVLPSKHHSSDYIFILDDKGRYAFWQMDGGFQLIQNHIKEQAQHLQLYKIYTHNLQQPKFCDKIHHFEVFDTRGSIFFNEGHEIVVLDYSIKLMGLKVEKPKRIKLDVIKYRFAGWVENNKHERWLALIEQLQEKTILKVYNLDRLHRICKENQLCRYQKINLLQFTSPFQNKLLVLSQNQVTLLQLPSMNVISTYNVRDTYGQLLAISPNIYGYLGQELILFSQTQMQSFGSLCLKDQNILADKGIAEVRFLRELGDGGKLISIVTYTNQIYFVILYGNTWKLGHKMQCMTPIFSFTKINNCSLLAVLSRGIEQYQVAVIESQMVVGFKKQQKFDSIIQRMVSILEGKALVMATKQRIIVLKQYSSSDEFQPTRISISNQQLIAANHNFIITTKGIYVIDTHNQICQQLHSESIVLVETLDKHAIFMNTELQVSQLDFESKHITHVRQAAANEYIWHFFNDTLVVGRSDDLQYLQLYKNSELTNKIKLQHSAIVSSMAHYISQQNTKYLIVGFTDGYISMIEIQNCLIYRNFENYANKPIQLQTIGNSLLISSQQKHLILKLQDGCSLTQISLASSEANIQSIAYLPHTRQIMIAENLSDKNCSIVKTVCWEQMISNERAINRSYTYQKHSIVSFSKQIPVVYAENNYIYVAVSKQIQIYNARTMICQKIINNFYTDVIGIERVEYGILVYGVDQLSRNILTVIQPQTLQVSPTISLILKDNKYIKSMKSLSSGGNRMLCRGQKYTTIYQISDTFQINEVNEFKTDFQGYSLDIDPTHEIFAITDSYRFAAFYTYKQGILPIARYVGQVEINDLCLIDSAVVIADRAGKITVLEFNVQNENSALKMMMTEVCSINVGDEVCSLAKISQKEVMYATVSGKIGTIKMISQSVFPVLKRIETEFLEQRSKYSEFDYKKWKNRQLDDKMIDCQLIGQFLQEKYHRNTHILKDPQFRQIKQFYHSIKTEMI